MNIAIVCEYNPFHFGHLHQIQEIKKVYPDSNIIAIMSGNVVQRGEFSILDKYYKTKIALNYGIDCVIEIPSVFSLQSAENFAFYSVKIIDSINCDYICFATESNIDNLIEYKNFLIKNENNIQNFNFENKTSSLNKNIMEFSKKYYKNYSEDIFMSNNILALEYMKSIDKLNSSTEILPIRRIASNYNSTDIEYVSHSASAIRKNIKSLNNFKDKIPKLSYEYLLDYAILDDEKILQLLSYKLLVEKSNMNDITGYENGLENLLQNNLDSNYKNYFDNMKNKKYSTNRLKRLILNYILNIQKGTVDDLIKSDIESVRVLGFNKKFNLSTINDNVNLYTINRDKKNLSEKYLNLFEYDIKVSQLIYSIKNVNDFYDFPIIKDDKN